MDPKNEHDPLPIDGAQLDLSGLEDVARRRRSIAIRPEAREAVLASRRVVDDDESDRIVSPDIEAAAALIASGEVLGAAEAVCGSLGS